MRANEDRGEAQWMDLQDDAESRAKLAADAAVCSTETTTVNVV